MKRMVWVLSIVLVGYLASNAQANPMRGFQRWLGISYGPGIHAYDGCHSYPYIYPTAEEVPSAQPVPATPQNTRPPAPPQDERSSRVNMPNRNGTR